MELLRIEYQRIWFDYAVADGTYTPAQLRKAGLVVKPGHEVLAYTLQWPGGITQPPTKEDTDWPFGYPPVVNLER